MGVSIFAEKITKRLAERKERVKAAKESNEEMYFYYLRGLDRHIFGGACLKKVDGVWCRGISLCSTKDQFDRNAAKGQSYGRLRKATVTQKDDFPITNLNESPMKLTRHYDFINNIGFKEFSYKARYNAVLTTKEKDIVKEVL